MATEIPFMRGEWDGPREYAAQVQNWPLEIHPAKTGAGHQLNSEARHMMSAIAHIEDAYSELTHAGNTTEVLDLRTSLHKIIIRLGELAHSAEEQYNQNT